MFVQILPHVVFTAQTPASGKVIYFLELLHRLNSFYVGATHIKEDIPIRIALTTHEPIELQRIYYAFVLGTCNFVS